LLKRPPLGARHDRLRLTDIPTRMCMTVITDILC
jgi:hypothetical protein